MPQTRQLVAIMFTDIVGYTALMGNDEKKAFEILEKNRILHKPIIAQFNGRFIKELGDGVMASFSTVSEAVNAALKIQEGCNLASHYQLRIGIHHGEVVFENDDIFGDTVNIAARIQATANPGCIYVSESVQNNISNKKDILSNFVKEESLKNVEEPVRIYEVLISSIIASSAEKPTQKHSIDKSIAVLPFANMSSDPEQEYFSDGIAEEIINSLVHIKDLKIAGRTSSAQFKGKNIDLREIGRKLGVENVLEGSIRKQGNRIRITAQLISVKDGFHLWSEKYDREMDDIFAIQDEIALAITEQLKITLFGDELKAITKVETQNVEAYELVMKGRFNLNRRGNSILKGLEFYKQAIAIDPNYAQAHSGYAWALFLMAFYGFLPGNEIMNEMKQAAVTSNQLDPFLEEAYLSLAQYYLCIERNYVEGQKNYIKVFVLNPKLAQSYSLYGMGFFGWVKGSFEEAEKQCHIGLKLEPLSAIDHADLSWTLYTAHKFEEALKVANIGIELDANSFLSSRLAGLSYSALNRHTEAIEILNHLVKISNRHQHALNSLIWVCCNAGKIKEAKKLFEELQNRSKTEYIAGMYLGISAASLNDIDLAFEYLENAFDDRDPTLIQIKYSPFVPSLLKKDSRFNELLQKIGFTN